MSTQGLKVYSQKLYLNFFKRSHRIITVSNAMKNEINKFYQNNKTDVIYNGIEKNYINSDKIKDQKYILTVGHFEKRKNFISLIYAFNMLSKKKKI